jgi:antitoxin Phd
MGRVIIQRKDGRTFALTPERIPSSPLDVPSIKATVSTDELVEIVRKERGRTRGGRRRV